MLYEFQIPEMSDQQNVSNAASNAAPTNGGQQANVPAAGNVGGDAPAAAGNVVAGQAGSSVNANPPTPPEVTNVVTEADVRAALGKRSVRRKCVYCNNSECC